MYSDDNEHFNLYYKRIGRWVRNDLLDWLGYERRNKFEEIDAIQYYIGDVAVFCFVVKVDRLLETCYVARRRGNDRGYQRALNEHRISEISKNISRGDRVIFPNSILINGHDLRASLTHPEECPKAVKVGFPLGYSTCRIIDGQHRLLGFTKLTVEEQKEHSLPVIALHSDDRLKEIRTFVDINSKQQRINGNLILSLKADFPWDKETNLKEYKEKIAVEVADDLNKTFFKNGIYFGSADERPGKKISLTTLVSSMVTNNLVLDDSEATRKKFRQTFSIIFKILFFGNDSFFKTNSGIRVLFRLINLFVRNLSAQRISVTEQEFFYDLAKLLDPDTINDLQQKAYGTYGGALNAANSLIQKLKESDKSDKKYADMESNLRSLRTRPKIKSAHRRDTGLAK